MKNAVFWDVALYTSCEMNRRFGGTHRLNLQGRRIRERETSVSRWRHIPEVGIPQNKYWLLENDQRIH
jgi:hypothetical protein